MFEIKNKSIGGHRFGKLELVDREIFYLCFNQRDN